MQSDQRYIVRLSAETVAVIQSLVDSGEFRTLSDAIRTILDSYAEDRLAKGVLPAPDLGDDYLCIEDLTIDGSSLDDAMYSAAREFAHRKVTGE